MAWIVLNDCFWQQIAHENFLEALSRVTCRHNGRNCQDVAYVRMIHVCSFRGQELQ
jgi:hypothetical protein